MQSIKLMKICLNEWETICKKRCLVHYRKQRGRGFPIGRLASAAAPLLGEIAKPIFKKVFSGRRIR